MSGARTIPPGRTAAPMAGARTGYITLFDVRFEHGYYNASGGTCPDFRVVPTPACAALMSQLGMVFKDHGTGFSVLVTQARAAAMIAWVRSHYAAGPQGQGYWSWLSFLMVPTNPGFVGITNLPITTNPMVQNLHLDNRVASAVAGRMLLSGGGDDALYPVTGASWSVPTPAGRIAALLDLSGAPVAARASVSDGVTRFDLTGLPYGWYSVSLTSKAGKPVAAKGFAATRLYVPQNPLSLVLLDLLLTQPVAGVGDAAAFPIPSMAAPPAKGAAPDPAEIQPVALTVAFQARATYWRYYVVAQGRGHFADDLTISGGAVAFTKSAKALPNGDHAVLFTAGTPLPLHQRAPQRFALSGHRQGANGSRDAISVARLPTAPATPVWPLSSPKEALSGSSEIYVYV
jgi:hypothetical protein